MNRLVVWLTLGFMLELFPAVAISEQAMQPLAQYESSSAELAIEEELDSARRALAAPTLSREERERLRTYEGALLTELRLARDPRPNTLHSALIANGEHSAAYPSVGALIYGGETVCTGTLIERGKFLTARHCFPPEPPARRYAVYLQHGGIYTVHKIHFPEAEGLDLAVVELDERVTGIRPTSLAEISTQADEQKQIVGFGQTAEGALDSGIKRQGGITTAACGSSEEFVCWSLPPTSILSDPPSNVCYKDSGGPIGVGVDGLLEIEDGVAKGLSPGEDCRSSLLNYSTAVFANVEWLESSGGSADHAVPELPECCGEGVNVVVGAGELPEAGGVRFKDWVFEVPDAVRVVRVGLNAMDAAPADLKLAVRATASLPYSPGCKDLGRYEFCEYRFDGTPPQSWVVRVETSGRSPFGYQLVVTMFEPLHGS